MYYVYHLDIDKFDSKFGHAVPSVESVNILNTLLLGGLECQPTDYLVRTTI